MSCLESKNDTIVNHLLQECNLVGKMIQTDKTCILYGDANQVGKILCLLLLNLYISVPNVEIYNFSVFK